jgi:hypothetical protein
MGAGVGMCEGEGAGRGLGDVWVDCGAGTVDVAGQGGLLKVDQVVLAALAGH